MAQLTDKKGETGGRMDRIKNNTMIERRKNRQRKVWVNDNRKKETERQGYRKNDEVSEIQ